MNRCLRCEVTKPLSDFHKYSRRDGYQSWCKQCRKEYDREYYVRMKSHHKQGRKESRIRRIEWQRELKRDKPCTDCGQVFPPEAMQWDHLPGFVKLGDISGGLISADRRLFLAELAKCELVCAKLSRPPHIPTTTGCSSA